MIASMERLEITCLRSRLAEIVDFLQESGLMHMEEVPLAVENVAGFLHRAQLTESETAELEQLEHLEGTLAEIAPLLSSRPNRTRINEAMEDLNRTTAREWSRTVRRWSRDLRSLTRRRANVSDNLEVIEHSRKLLDSLSPILGERKAILGVNARAILLRDDPEIEASRIRERLETIVGPECRLSTRKLGKDQAVALIEYTEGDDGLVTEIISDEGVARIELPEKEYQGLSVQETIDKLEESTGRFKEDLEQIERDLESFSTEKGPELRAMKMVVANRTGRLRVVHDFAVSNMVAVMHGWAPTDGIKSFLDSVEKRFGDEAVVGYLPKNDVEPDRIPTLLRNAPVVEPFQVLLGLFKPPAYGTTDPTILVGVFFVLFYGFILGDIGYGLIIIALAFLLRRFLGHIAAIKSASIVAVYCGVSAIVFGLLYGEFFGDIGAQLGLPHLLFHRGESPQHLLVIAVAIGAIHVVLSLVLGVRENLRHHHTQHAKEKLGMLLGLLAVGVGVLSYSGVLKGLSTPANVVCALLMIASVFLLVRASGFLAPIQMLEVVSLVGNVLSYSRLMALGIASMVLADVANSMVETMGNVYVGILMAVLIHVVNIALGIFSPALHSLRLNYVEFLPKFYEPVGRRYQPFRKESLS